MLGSKKSLISLRRKRAGGGKTVSSISGYPLRLEDEAGANLVGGLVELLGVDGGAEAEGDALTEEDVVANGDDTAVVELDLEGERENVSKRELVRAGDASGVRRRLERRVKERGNQ